MDNQIDYQALNEEVERGTKKLKGILRGTYLALSTGMFGLFGIISLASGQAEVAAGLLGMGWLTTLIFYWISGLSDFGVMDKAYRHQAMQRALNQQMMARMQAEMQASLYNTDKPKRDDAVQRDAELRLRDDAGEQVMELSDDGELIPSEEQTERRNANRE